MAENGESGPLLQLFWDLASVEEGERLRAAEEMVLSLKELQVR